MGDCLLFGLSCRSVGIVWRDAHLAMLGEFLLQGGATYPDGLQESTL